MGLLAEGARRAEVLITQAGRGPGDQPDPLGADHERLPVGCFAGQGDPARSPMAFRARVAPDAARVTSQLNPVPVIVICRVDPPVQASSMGARRVPASAGPK
jgi:hypothetical protein